MKHESAVGRRQTGLRPRRLESGVAGGPMRGHGTLVLVGPAVTSASAAPAYRPLVAPLFVAESVIAVRSVAIIDTRTPGDTIIVVNIIFIYFSFGGRLAVGTSVAAAMRARRKRMDAACSPPKAKAKQRRSLGNRRGRAAAPNPVENSDDRVRLAASMAAPRTGTRTVRTADPVRVSSPRRPFPVAGQVVAPSGAASDAVSAVVFAAPKAAIHAKVAANAALAPPSAHVLRKAALVSSGVASTLECFATDRRLAAATDELRCAPFAVALVAAAAPPRFWVGLAAPALICLFEWLSRAADDDGDCGVGTRSSATTVSPAF